MKKKLLLLLTFSAIITILLFIIPKSGSNKLQEGGEKSKKEYADKNRLQQEFLMLRDPVTNRIPDNIRYLEQEFAAKLPKTPEYFLSKGGPVKNVQSLTWTERGPNNVAGRVRGLGIDIRTTGTPTMIAGGQNGGIWKSTDGGSTWTRKTGLSHNQSVSCVVQDARSGSEDIWYYGTGEAVSGSADGGGSEASFFGDGIYKSTDNGESWTQLASTAPSNISQFSTGFQYVFNLAIHPTSGNVYAATVAGIHRSTNGGTSWTLMLDAGSLSSSNRFDVAIASDGTIYAAGNSASGAAGFRKSTDDGASWSDVSPTLPGTYKRTIVKVAPSNASVIYYFMEGVSGANNTPNVHNHMLWRSTDAGSSWNNISSVIPANTAPTLDNFSTQDGYDMLLSVKPDDPNFIIIGGVSIFKIEDVTNDNMTLAQKHIGGYGISGNSTANALGDFINHHPDSHLGVFKPGSNIIFYCANDGGIHLANDITAASSGTFWSTPLRTGMNISQFYHISLDKTNGSGFISGGLQDRGNWMARTNGATVNWQECSGGDGAFTEIDPTGTNVFMSTTNGNLFRFAKSNETSPIDQTTVMKPANLNNPLFINPFDLDGNSGSIMYFAGGNTSGSTSTGIWRSTDADAETPSWTYFTNSNVESEQVSAVSVSNTNSANVLYYGTSGGKVYRIDNANSAAASVTPANITGGSFPAGYVSSIAVDPDNSANVLVVFSNYNVDRIWYSTNSGTDWTSVSGNLTGTSAPSVRWAKMFSVSGTPHYFIGTSTGLYYTITLNGGSTTWTQEATTSVGNNIVVAIDYRSSDNTLVLATHGRGVFETQVSTPLPVELTSFSGRIDGNSVVLNWQTATETMNYGFEIERREGSGSWANIGFVRGAGYSNSVKNYTFTDRNPDKTTLDYRIKQIDTDGRFSYSNTVKVDFNIPSSFVLKQNYPNPFNPSTTISFSVPFKTTVRLEVFDITGKLMITLLNEQKEAGNYSINYNAGYLASGTYFYRLTAGNNSITKKMLLLQ